MLSTIAFSGRYRCSASTSATLETSSGSVENLTSPPATAASDDAARSAAPSGLPPPKGRQQPRRPMRHAEPVRRTCQRGGQDLGRPPSAAGPSLKHSRGPREER